MAKKQIETKALTEIFEETVSETGLIKQEKNELSENSDKAKKAIKGVDFTPFYEIAKLQNSSVFQVVEDCCMYQVRVLMEKLGKVIVRYNVFESTISKILCNANTLKIGEVLVAPVYIPSCRRQVIKNNLHNLYVGGIIDFPFGESSFKTKLTEIKEGIKQGVDGITVMLPAMLLKKESQKELKKQVKKLGAFYKKDAGVGISAMDITEEEIKTVIKAVEKSRLGFIVFVFGETSENELKEKMSCINKYKGKKLIKVLGNIATPNAVMELNKCGVDKILTPYADEIGRELMERFKIKSVKLK